MAVLNLTCEVCGAAKSRSRTLCSAPSCKAKRQKPGARRVITSRPTVCAYCNETFDSGDIRRFYCYTQVCVRAHRAKQQRDGGYSTKSRAKLGRPDSTVAADKRRKALLRGAVTDGRFTNPEVFERDNWACGICLTQVDPNLSYPDPMSVSLDHVLAIARGGSHTFTNVRCSHLACNVRRQTGESEVPHAPSFAAVRDLRGIQEAPAA